MTKAAYSVGIIPHEVESPLPLNGHAGLLLQVAKDRFGSKAVELIETGRGRQLFAENQNLG